MRYLRMLSNSIAAGLLADAYLLFLFLQLNPALPSDAHGLAPLAVTIGFFYLVHLTAAFYILLVVGQLLSRELFSPAWLSVSVLSWLGAAASAGAAALTWANVRTFGIVLEQPTVDSMMTSIVVLAAASAMFTIAALARARAGSGGYVLGGFVTLVAGGSVAALMIVRGPATVPPLESHPLPVAFDVAPRDNASRVTIVALDAGSLDFVASAAAEGRLPNFGRILDAGAVMHLATIHPTAAETVWAAAATGKLPQKNGVRSSGTYHLSRGDESIQLLPAFCFATNLISFGILSNEPYTAATIRTRTLWTILSTQGLTVGVVNWPLTYPAPAVRGYIISDQYARLAQTPSAIDDPGLLYPPELRLEALQTFRSLAGESPSVLPSDMEVEARHREPGTSDLVNGRLSDALTSAHPAAVNVIRYQSLDPIGHYFLRYAEPEAFGDVSEDERRAFGSVLEMHYAMIDAALGRAIARLGPDDLLLVVSAYGLEPLGLGRRLVERLAGDPDLSGAHEGAPDGFLMAYGPAVAKARSRPRASILDIVPTVLYFLGLPIGRDMDGYARTDIFQAAFTENRPLTFIPTYDR